MESNRTNPVPVALSVDPACNVAVCKTVITGSNPVAASKERTR